MAKTKKDDIDKSTESVENIAEESKAVVEESVIVEKPTQNKVEWVLDRNGKTNVRNITNIGISIILENTIGRRGEIHIPPKQARPIGNEEIMIKVESQNPSFCGTDGLGANASLYIEDEDFRKYLNFETDNKKQELLSAESLEKIYNADKLTTFKSLIKKSVVTYAEKNSLIAYLTEKYNSGEFDSVSKIDFVEEYTGSKIRQ